MPVLMTDYIYILLVTYLAPLKQQLTKDLFLSLFIYVFHNISCTWKAVWSVESMLIAQGLLVVPTTTSLKGVELCRPFMWLWRRSPDHEPKSSLSAFPEFYSFLGFTVKVFSTDKLEWLSVIDSALWWEISVYYF